MLLLIFIGVTTSQYITTNNSCNTGEYLYELATDLNYCFTCQKGCKSCCDPYLCLECEQNYRFNSTLSTCIRCPVYCQTCEANGLFSKCTQCQTGYIPSSDGGCVKCGDDCLACTMKDYCTVCKPQFYVNTGVCKDCTYGCSSCQQSETTLICDSCIEGYYLSEEQCLVCPTGCKDCKDIFTCTSCSDGYYLKDEKECLVCKANCKECEGTTCKTCLVGYAKVNDECAGCPDINCNECEASDVNKCITCVSGYYNLNQTCIVCAKNCEICDAPNHCSKCTDGSFNKSGTCVTNTITNCLTQSETACTSCASGYYISSSGECTACTKNCLKCSADYQCDQCITGNYFNGFTCSQCVTGCEKCKDNYTCERCTYGYYYDRGSCSRCTDAICGCSQHEIGNCNDNYYYIIMNSFYKRLSSEFIESSQQNASKKPNMFCLNIFNRPSFDEPIQDEHILQQQQYSISQFFLNPQASLDLKQRVPSLEKFIKKKKKRKAQFQSAALRDYKKNICRNVLRHGIKALMNQRSQQFLMKQFDQCGEEVAEFQKFYQSNLEIISGFRVLKDHLISKEEENKVTLKRKKIFREYLIWFLITQASKYILQSEASSLADYLRYKNEVLLYYVQLPQCWYSNKALWKQDCIQVKKEEQ